jgi:hypothetical protein
MNRYYFDDLTVEFYDDPTYTFGSMDNNCVYSKTYFGDGGQKYPIAKHGVKILKEDQVIDSCIIIGSGGATGVHQNSALLDNDQFVLCCCDTIFCLTLPSLGLKWKTKADPATCFQIFKHEDDYIIHGELQVTKIDQTGQIKWEFGGADIFVSIDGEEEFKIENDGIMLTDFTKAKYKIDFDGKLIGDRR